MNTLDMQTKEKVNTIHVAEMQHAALNRHLVRNLKPSRIPALSSVRIRLALIALVLAVLAGTFLIPKF